MPRTLAEPDLQSGHLTRPIDLEQESAGAYYFLCRAHQADATAIRSFREWLFAELDSPNTELAQASI